MNRKMFPVAVVAALLVGLSERASAQPAPSQQLTRIERFSGRVQAKRKDGTPVELQVTVRDWIVPNFTRIERFPQEGALVVQLRAGEAITVIHGERKTRAVDELWTVPAGTGMELETRNDSVILQTVAAVLTPR